MGSLREQALRPDDQHREEGDMTGDEGQADIDVTADRLGDAEENSAGQGTPQAAQPANDDRLEAEDQAAAGRRRD